MSHCCVVCRKAADKSEKVQEIIAFNVVVMSDDRDVLRAIWDGRVSACFTLSSYEVETLTAPAPYYLMLPRDEAIQQWN